MKYLIFLLIPLCVVFFSNNYKDKNSVLLPIIEQGKHGFINAEGKVIIKPVFANIRTFTEGVAPARIDGLFGFIDSTGQWVIEPQFEFATEFKNGFAIVFNNQKTFYINHLGQKTFNTDFAKALSPFEKGVAVFKTVTGKQGLLNKNGEIIADTIFDVFYDLNEGLAIVKGINHESQKGKKKIYEIGIIDTNGRFVVPFGLYADIKSSSSNKYFLVDYLDHNSYGTSSSGILDKTGKVILRKRFKNGSWIDNPFEVKYDMFKVNLTDKELKEDDEDIFENDYDGLFNLKGEKVFGKLEYGSIEYFDNEKVEVTTEDKEKLTIDLKTGKILNRKKKNDKVFVDSDKRANKYGFEIIRDNDGLEKGVRDSLGNWILPLAFYDIKEDALNYGFFLVQKKFPLNNTGQKSNQMFKSFDDEYNAYQRLWGVCDIKGKELIAPQYSNIYLADTLNEIFYVVSADKNHVGYIKKNGQFIWKTSTPSNESFDIDYMNRGYIYAYSAPDSNNRSGGWSVSGNFPIVITDSKNYQSGKISAYVDTVKSMGEYRNSYTFFIANNTDTLAKFAAQDSRLYVKMQAQKENGKWYDIEYLPSSWCGNSYHSLELKPNHQWRFDVPIYKGSLNVKLRIAVSNVGAWRKEWENLVYSNEWFGSVNPSQFWRKADYFPSGLMDPYLE
jgi:WG containing repeat